MINATILEAVERERELHFREKESGFAKQSDTIHLPNNWHNS